MNKTINGILKKAIILILCLTFTSGLMGAACAYEVGDQTSNELYELIKANEAYNKIHDLIKAKDEFLKVAIEEAKEKVCENLKVSRELLDETTKNVKIAATFGEKTEYIPVRNMIFVAAWDMIMDEHDTGINKETNLAHELALAFIDNYLHKDREEVLCEKAIPKIFADLCDKNILSSPDMMELPIRLNKTCCDKKQAGKILKNQYRRVIKYWVQKWLDDGNITPLEFLDKVKANKSFKGALIETLSEPDARKALKDLIKKNIISDGLDM